MEKRTVEYSEIFMSIEGEGPYSGTPTIYTRFARCNFQCRKFNNPEMKPIELKFNPADIKRIQDIPVIDMGCDSIYSWREDFKHLWKTVDVDQLAEDMQAHLPYGKWVYPNGLPVTFSITGGEPTLHQKFLIEFLEHPFMKECKHILIETNASVPLRPEFIKALQQYVRYGGHLTWSNSPKLESQSGEPFAAAIKPKVLLDQVKAFGYYDEEANEGGETSVTHLNQYFKFVSDGSEESFADIDKVMQTYYNAGLDQQSRIYIMPMACTEEQQMEVAQKVAAQCIERGYVYCHRIQNSVWGNTVGV